MKTFLFFYFVPTIFSSDLHGVSVSVSEIRISYKNCYFDLNIILMMSKINDKRRQNVSSR